MPRPLLQLQLSNPRCSRPVQPLSSTSQLPQGPRFPRPVSCSSLRIHILDYGMTRAAMQR